MKKCPYCAEDIQDEAKVCRYCQRDLATGAVGIHAVAVPQWSKGVAAVLSLVIPGAGQMYKGQVVNGLVWLVVVVVGYLLFILPGLVMHVCCILGAASGDPYAQQRSIGGPKRPVAPRPKGSDPFDYCPHCGRKTQFSDRTCPSCGKGLSGAALLAD